MIPEMDAPKKEVKVDSPFTDETRMPFGNWIGKPLRNVPAWHLLWLGDQDWIQNPTSDRNRKLRDYIEENREVLEKQKAEGIE